MSHFITVPINENGVIVDENIATEITIGCAPRFGTTDVFLYSHGWWTSAIRAITQYNLFSMAFVDKGLQIAAMEPPPLTRLPKKSLGIGLHWPSMLSEDQNSLFNLAEATSFYTMEKRADTVGEHGLYSILRMVVEANQQAKTPLRFHLLGHSFGCKVVCAALQALADDNTLGIKTALDINIVLLQAAFENNDLDTGEIYGDVPTDRFNARLLVTTSQVDTALTKRFRQAKTINIFSGNHIRIAMGDQGPTDTTKQRFGGCTNLEVAPGFTHAQFNPGEGRLFCADLTKLHQANQTSGFYKGDNFGGHHSDIYNQEIYELLASFLFR